MSVHYTIHLDITPENERYLTTLCGYKLDSKNEQIWIDWLEKNTFVDYTDENFIEELTCVDCLEHPNLVLYEMQSINS